MKIRFFLAICLAFIGCASLGHAGDRCSFWLDLYRGEPVAWEDMLDDLASSKIVFLGEVHTLQRHHDLQTQIITALSDRGKKVLLGVEQMEARFDDWMQRYNRGEITFDELASSTEWRTRWENCADYRPILEAAIHSGGRVVSLNARAETIRAIGRGGLDSLSESDRGELPQEMVFDEPLYETLLNKLMLIHMAFTEEMLRNVYRAQVARDETMAENMANAWKALDDPDEWVGVVICGAGHCSYGLGTASRLSRRLPDLPQRVVLMSESGDVVLSKAEKAMTREIEITHEDLRFLNQPIADYLHAMEQNPDAEE
ncbi:MAG: hypothetical protein GC154_21885 [bacterium]|nr:hypothetical protein [bacterium]